ncbi:MAG: LysR substrate-binding domain-containing protein [Burkholderiaceae bacterium]
MVELYEKYPGIDLDLIDTQNNLDLASREADIAIRLARPNIASAVASRIGNLSFRVYVARRFLNRAESLPWIGYSESKAHLPEAIWLAQNRGEAGMLMRTDDAALRAGLVTHVPCRALLPDARVTKDMGLVAVGGPKPVLQRELWLVYMKELRANARVAAVAQWAKRACRVRMS